jgi:hypothetical protein
MRTIGSAVRRWFYVSRRGVGLCDSLRSHWCRAKQSTPLGIEPWVRGMPGDGPQGPAEEAHHRPQATIPDNETRSGCDRNPICRWHLWGNRISGLPIQNGSSQNGSRGRGAG